MGRLLAELRTLGLDDNTLVIFTTDNGTRSGSSGPLRGAKARMYEGGIREPAIMRWPRAIPAGTTCPEPAATMDILPTLAGLARSSQVALTVSGDHSGILVTSATLAQSWSASPRITRSTETVSATASHLAVVVEDELGDGHTVGQRDPRARPGHGRATTGRTAPSNRR